MLGHEFTGEVVEVGSGNTALHVGDRIVIPFTIACGECFFCKKGLTSCCDRSNPNQKVAETMMGHSPSGLFGYSHMLGGFAGGQAEYNLQISRWMANDVRIYKPAEHKTAHHGRQRTIAMGPRGQAVLRPFLKPLNSTVYVFNPADAVAEMRDRRNAERKTPPNQGNAIGTNRAYMPRRTPGNR